MGNDDRPIFSNLRVRLIDFIFNGEATASEIVITDGGFKPNGSVTVISLGDRYAVSTFAGSSQGSADALGSAAQFNGLSDLALDASGNLYVSDTENNRIRRITPAGQVTTLAGGAQGSNDGTGVAAEFSNPTGIAVAHDGNIYVADTWNNRIRKITPAGQVTTLAGSTFGFSNGVGSGAQFGNPYGIAAAPNGNLYVADTWNNCIRVVSPEGQVTTLAGSGQEGFADGRGTAARFNNPAGLSVDTQGTLYVADTWNNRIRKVTPDGMVTTLAGSGTEGYGDGPASIAQFQNPSGITVDQQGNVYIADTWNNRIRMITTGGIVKTVAGSSFGFANGKGSAARFSNPTGVAVDGSGSLFIADFLNHLVRQIKPTNT